MEDEKLNQTFDIKSMQKIQDNFSRLMGFAAVVLTIQGEMVTDCSCFSELCRKYVRMSPVGYEACEKCIAERIREVIDGKKSIVYRCHIGLVNFMVPLLLEDEVVAVFYGGQVLTSEPDMYFFRKKALEIDVNPHRFWKALQKVNITTKREIRKAVDYLETVVETLIELTVSRYQVMETETEAKKVAQMKSDFLANMSHEIRTPMNAVIGMAEMALREQMNRDARDYIRQIQTSGKALLSLINDILDFSKIQAGKMHLREELYSVSELALEIMNMMQAKVSNPNVEMILKINPEIPVRLRGDSNRIRQVVVNILNNAVKFTQNGSIVLNIDFQRTDEENIILDMSVRDSGIGIKEQDLKGIFESFQQVDSKRNRNIEGTGLGLAITKNLVDMMHGQITVESTYGEGSCFSVQIPQRIAITDTSIQIENPDSHIVYIMLPEGALRRALHEILDQLRVSYQDITSCALIPVVDFKEKRYLFTDENHWGDMLVDFVAVRRNISVILLADYYSTLKFAQENLRIMKRPFSTNLVAAFLNGEELQIGRAANEQIIHFVAPEARVLMVDDNLINLQVDVGLLEPLEMQIDTAQSGKEAIDLIAGKQYDLIFMDHMMPEMDGVETTHIIRSFYENYRDVPIIALTGNVADGIEQEFIREGMNDFVPKPVEVKVLLEKLRQWLPPEKIKKAPNPVPARTGDGDTDYFSADAYIAAAVEGTEEDEPVPGLDIKGAINMLQSEELYQIILESYCQAIPDRIKQFQNILETDNKREYLIEIHALKSVSRQVGAMALGDMAEELNDLAKQDEWETIKEKMPAFLEQYEKTGDELKKARKNKG
ncbi:MAG: PocR ligand-binding domain-containing protein [Clostridiaceae bacterium]|nr:PocR ligand-binding domain-containing protein [Clostridiaceae bacterium]